MTSRLRSLCDHGSQDKWFHEDCFHPQTNNAENTFFGVSRPEFRALKHESRIVVVVSP